ncbi:MAG TPA: multicopper oxidase family protein [Candidatus Cybelea sp.]|nr:multicopper oxidase family protein [Candidatus Cybelea sp.]
MKIRRREFLFGAAALSAMTLRPPSARALDQESLDITLTAAPFRFAPAAGVDFDGLAYNGMVPGPLIRVGLGQMLRANFVNRSGRPGTIHWHGMVLPNGMDGAEGVTQDAVPDGAETVYSFKAEPSGLRWYHSHPVVEQARGLFGALIVVDPKDEPADVEAVIVLHEVPDLKSFAAAVAGNSGAPMLAPSDAPELAMHRRMMAGMDMAHMDHAPAKGAGHDMPGMDMSHMDHGAPGGAHAMGMGDEVAYVARCVNGGSYPKNAPILVKPGQRVRLRILNASPNRTHYVRLGGHRLKVTHSDGNALPAPVNVDVLRIGAAERYDAWFEVKERGAWLLQSIANDAMAKQQAVRVHTVGYEAAEPVRPAAVLKGANVFSYAAAGAASTLKLPAADLTRNMVLNGGTMGDPDWTIDGKIWPDVPPVQVRSGNRVLIRFRNDSMMDHPMHLHGHVFDLVEVDGRSLAKPLRKDTTLVGGMGGTASWLVTANAPPGRWLLHCHNAVHMAGGMMTEMVYI